MKGIMLLVIRINVCVVKDYGLFVFDFRLKLKGKDKYFSKVFKYYFLSSDVKRFLGEDFL